MRAVFPADPKEISNGRFAMICVVGILAAELATGKDAIQQFSL